MGYRNTLESYGHISKFVHWLIFILVTAAIFVGVFMDDIPAGEFKGQVYNLHKLVGMTIFTIMLFRVIWRITNPIPDLKMYLKPWEFLVERVVMLLLYVLLLAMPISGWIMSTAAGKAPNFFGLAALPMPGIPLDKDLAGMAAQAHYVIAWALSVFIVLHILAAFKHHFINKDIILKRMLPGNWLE